MQLLSDMTAKPIERCPLNYPLVRYLSSLNPLKMISSASDVTAKFEKILQILMIGSCRSAGECDELLFQYKAFGKCRTWSFWCFGHNWSCFLTIWCLGLGWREMNCWHCISVQHYPTKRDTFIDTSQVKRYG